MRRFERAVRAAGAVAVVAMAAGWLCGCATPEPRLVGLALGSEGILGAELAAADVNAEGGVHAHRIQLVTRGNGTNSSAEAALVAADSLARDDRVLAVVGHGNSAASLAASQVYNSRHVVQIAPTSTAPLYGKAGRYSFRLVGSDEHQADFLAKAVMSRPSRNRVAIVYVNDDYGRALHGLLVDRLAASGIHPLLDAPYAEDERFDGSHELVSMLVRTKPDLLVWLGRAHPFAGIGPAVRQNLPSLSVLASDGFGGVFAPRAPQPVFAGVEYVRMVDLRLGGDRMRRLRERYEKRTGAPLTDQAALSYDAVLLCAEAIRRAGPDREAIRRWLSELGRSRPPFMGATGPIAFSPTGERAATYVLERVTFAGSPSALDSAAR